MNAKPGDMEGKLYIIGKNLHVSEPVPFKPMLFKSQPCRIMVALQGCGGRLVSCVPATTEDEAYASHPGPRVPWDRLAAMSNGENKS